MNDTRLCQHCALHACSSTRRLCWTCYKTPSVRRLYPPRRFAELGAKLWTAPLSPTPTTAIPGTEDKVRVLEDRAAKGLALFHPDDVTCFHW